MELKPGSRWKSAVCDVEIVIVRSSAAPAQLECGGHAVVAHADPKPEGLVLAPQAAQGCQPGKRYADETSGLEVLCTKGGQGSLALDGRLLVAKDAKKLPSSD
jgi:hypothetical protein